MIIHFAKDLLVVLETRTPFLICPERPLHRTGHLSFGALVLQSQRLWRLL